MGIEPSNLSTSLVVVGIETWTRGCSRYAGYINRILQHGSAITHFVLAVPVIFSTGEDGYQEKIAETPPFFLNFMISRRLSSVILGATSSADYSARNAGRVV